MFIGVLMTVAQLNTSAHSKLIIPRTSMAFDRYKKETPHAVRGQEVTGTFTQIRDVWLKWKKEINDYNASSIDYDAAVSALQGIRISPRDVERFCVLLIDHQEEESWFRSGLFISAMINSSSDSDFTISTKHFSKQIRDLGYRNTKNLTIKNDGGISLSSVGDYAVSGAIKINGIVMSVGSSMSGGRIIVDGSVRFFLGPEMSGGSIIIHGNVGRGIHDSSGNIGSHMKGGTILVFGNAHANVGSYMQGGIIKIHQNVTDSIGLSMENGIIIVKGNAEAVVGLEMNGGFISIVGNGGRSFSASVGYNMHGGEIRVEGDEIYIDDSRSMKIFGRIYHKGRLIFPKESDVK